MVSGADWDDTYVLIFYCPPPNEVQGGLRNSLRPYVRPSVRPSVRTSVRTHIGGLCDENVRTNGVMWRFCLCDVFVWRWPFKCVKNDFCDCTINGELCDFFFFECKNAWLGHRCPFSCKFFLSILQMFGRFSPCATALLRVLFADAGHMVLPAHVICNSQSACQKLLQRPFFAGRKMATTGNHPSAIFLCL